MDTLLSLQNPKTDFPDELVFIIYHQVTELQFKLALHELEQPITRLRAAPEIAGILLNCVTIGVNARKRLMTGSLLSGLRRLISAR